MTGAVTSTVVRTADSSVLTPIFTSGFSFAIPAGTLVGDFAVLIALARVGDTFNTPAGWTLVNSFQVQTNGVARIYTRVIQASDTSIALSYSNVGVNYLCVLASYTGASLIAANGQMLNAASSTVLNFANVSAPQREMHAMFICMCSGIASTPWFTLPNAGNLTGTLFGAQVSSSPPPYRGAVGLGRMIPGTADTGTVVGSTVAAAVHSTAMLLIQ